MSRARTFAVDARRMVVGVCCLLVFVAIGAAGVMVVLGFLFGGQGTWFP